MTPSAVAAICTLAAAQARAGNAVAAERLVFDLARRLSREKHTPRIVPAPVATLRLVQGGRKGT